MFFVDNPQKYINLLNNKLNIFYFTNCNTNFKNK
jgi:hypothetical protein